MKEWWRLIVVSAFCVILEIGMAVIDGDHTLEANQESQVTTIPTPSICGESAANPHGPHGMWHYRESARKMLDDAQWGQFVDYVLAKDYPAECTVSILRAAVNPQRASPFPMGLITSFNDFKQAPKK